MPGKAFFVTCTEWTVIETRWGYVGASARSGTLWYAGFPERTESDAVRALHLERGDVGRHAPREFERFAERLGAYFAGEKVDWSDLPVALPGTAFQRRVYEATREVRHGQTATYGDIAFLAGYPRAARAVGSALAANPAGLLVPCHRIVSSIGVGGYGSHPEQKLALLRLEGVEIPASHHTRLP
jgi:methylated-DNA-[protein]-cysteine S-methyltransferase